jgi:hypothetical protein
MSLSTGEKFIVGAIVGLFILAIWAGLTTIVAVLFMWAWNLFMPLVWATAPKIGFWHAIAAGFLLGAIKGIFQFSQSVTKS